MTPNEYQHLAYRTMNGKLSDQEVLLNCALGLAGESGELIDAIKKHVFHGHKLSKTYVHKELGDILWYLSCMGHSLGLPLESIMATNIAKLEKRYDGEFTEEKSQNREGANE